MKFSSPLARKMPLPADPTAALFHHPHWRRKPLLPRSHQHLSARRREVVPHPVDEEGIVLNERPCDYYYVTPGHQVPTGVTMSSARRRQLLEHAARHDAVIIEDDYDSESNFTLNPLPALKASDRSGRVVYVSSLSKALSPGLRLGLWSPTRTD